MWVDSLVAYLVVVKAARMAVSMVEMKVGKMEPKLAAEMAAYWVDSRADGKE